MEHLKPYIICDTNIWYNISSGIITQKDLPFGTLVGTYISAFELCASFNLANHYDSIQAAIDCFCNKAGLYAQESPIEFIKLVSGYDFNSDDWDILKMGMETFVIPTNVQRNSRILEYLEKRIERANEAILPFINVLNTYRQRTDLSAVRRKLKRIGEKEKHLELTKEFLLTLTGPGFKLDWQKLELFLLTFDEWLRQLETSQTLKMTLNDLNDVLNLVYVQPGSFEMV